MLRMYKTALLGLLAGAVLCLPDLSTSALAEAKVGVSAAVTGRAFVRSGGAERRAAVEESIFLQDEVLTKQQSALQILLLDQSVFTVGENCEMIIDRFVFDPDTDAGEMSGRVLKGAFRFMSGKIGKANPSNANIATPSGTIGIRGTMMEGIVGADAINLAQLSGLSVGNADPERAFLAVLRGPGHGTNVLTRTGVITVGNSAGQKTISTPNYGVFVPGPGQRPIGPFKINGDILSYLNLYLRTRPGDGPSYGGNDVSGEKASGQDYFNTPDDVGSPLNDQFADEFFDNQAVNEDDGGGNGGNGGNEGNFGNNGGNEGNFGNNGGNFGNNGGNEGNFGNNGGNEGNFGNEGNYGNYGNYGNEGNYGNYGNYGNEGNEGNGGVIIGNVPALSTNDAQSTLQSQENGFEKAGEGFGRGRSFGEGFGRRGGGFGRRGEFGEGFGGFDGSGGGGGRFDGGFGRSRNRSSD